MTLADEVYGAIAARHQAAQDAPPPPIDPSSQLAVDDAALAPHLLSGSIRGHVNKSLDHLEAVRSTARVAGTIHPWAQFTLLRSALENAATAVWLISPSESQERRVRLLNLLWRDLDESAKAAELHEQGAPSGRTVEERRKELLDLTPEGCRGRVRARLSYGSVVQLAAEPSGLTADHVEFSWRLLSGLAHGAQWATIGFLKRTDHPAENPDHVHARFYAEPRHLVTFARLSLTLIDTVDYYWGERALTLDDDNWSPGMQVTGHL